LARQKSRKFHWALLHGALYALPFLLFCHASWTQIVIISVFHGLQDFLLWRSVGDGKHMGGLEGGVTIVRDNTLHLALNWWILS
jgi:hypothetical protein